MSATHRILVPLSLLVYSFFAISCGGSGGSHTITGQPPIFSTTPPTAAAQNTAYSYAAAATDPSGGSVTFALTTGPTGATMSGANLSWTPTAAQSRTGSNFTITATTSENATATQSWTVSPTGVVTVNAVDTYWTASGPVQVPVINASSLQISAVVPQSDGSILVLKGATASPGVITISGVPAGNYWLAVTTANLIPQSLSTAYWTSTSTFDLGRDIAGFPPPTMTSTNLTTFDFSLSGLASVNTNSQVLFNPEVQAVSGFLSVPPNSTTTTGNFGYGSNIDWSKVSNAFLLQYAPLTLAPLNFATLAASANPTNLSLTDGTTNPITEALSTIPLTQVNLTVQGTQFQPLFSNVGPAAATGYASAFTLLTEPYVTGTNAQATLTPANVVLAGTTALAGQGIITLYPFGTCNATGFPGGNPLNTTPGILNDTNLGALSYIDPFPVAWTRAETFCEQATIPIAIPGTSATADFALVNGVATVPSSSPIVPLVSPVQNPTIAGGNLLTAATLTSTTPTLSWSAPTTGSPYGYRVAVYVLGSTNQIPAYVGAGSFFTSDTSITLPPLSAGNTYVFAIVAEVDGKANVQTAPLRSALPTASAMVVSAPITISAGAAQARIRGDARVIRRMTQPSAGK